MWTGSLIHLPLTRPPSPRAGRAASRQCVLCLRTGQNVPNGRVLYLLITDGDNVLGEIRHVMYMQLGIQPLTV